MHAIPRSSFARISPLTALVALAALAAPAPRAQAQICAGPVHGEPFTVSKVFDTGALLYAAGSLAPSTWGIASYDGAQWSVLPGAFDGPIESLEQTSFGLIAGGAFEAIDGAPRSRVARFDGQAWLALGLGIDGPSAKVLAVHEHAGELHVAGSFDSASGVQSANVARWNGAAWSGLLGGTDGEVRALASYAGALVVGGDFDSAGGLAVQNVAQWNGSSWSSVGAQQLAPVHDLAVDGTRLYAASGALRILAGGNWVPVGAPPGIDVRSIAIAPSGIYVHGPWQALCLAFNGGPCLQRARFVDGAWLSFAFDEFDPELDSLSLAVLGDAVYETGDTQGLRIYSGAPKLHAWTPTHGAWYAETQLELSLACLDPLQPALVSVDGQPLATTVFGANSVGAIVPADFTNQTGPLELRFEQGGVTIVVPGGFVSRPALVTDVFALFAQNFKFRVQSSSGVGTAWILISGQNVPQQLALPGVHALLDLDLGTGSVLGAGVLAPDSALPATLGFVLPLGTIPPGLKFRAQSFVAEQTTGGVRLAFTNAVNVTAP